MSNISVSCTFLGAAFLYFVCSMTISGLVPKFLSLNSNTTDQTCTAVPVQIYGEYEGDMYGNWVTSPDFQQNYSAFAVKFSGSQVTTEQYQVIMKGFKQKLKTLSAKSARRDSG
jgi:hypothetical protein